MTRKSDMQSLLEKALSIALSAHTAQKDKGGSPYILHPLRVMMAMETTEEQTVALLHDVVEDSAITIQDLKEEGFGDEILTAVDLLTKKKGQTYEEYLVHIRENSLARKVKQADLEDNMNTKRLKKINDDDLKRLDKYRAAFKFLTS